MSDFSTFLLSGVLCKVAIDDPEARVREVFGAPDYYEPAHKSYPAFTIYGPVEFRSRNGRISYIGISLVSELSVPSVLQPCVDEGKAFHIDTNRQILLENKIDYTLDPIMTDETQTVIVTSKAVHLAFDDHGRLGKIAAVGCAEEG